MIPMQSEKLDQLEIAISKLHKKYGVIIEMDKQGNHAKYATLTQILQLIYERGSEFGLVLRQKSMRMDGENCVYTRVSHPESGQWDASISAVTIVDNPKNPNQEWSGSTTTHRRYDAMAILGLFQAHDPSDHDGDKSEENPQGNSSFTSNAPKETFKLPSQKSGCINENQLRKFNAMAKDPKFPQNKQKAAGYIAKYGAADNIPWKVFNSIVEDMQSTSGPIQQQITEVFGDGELEEVF